MTSILKIVYTKSFKFGASIDKDGIVIIWDFIRFKYVRKLFPPVLTEENTTVNPLLAVSNESGNFATVHFNKHLNGQLQLFTINGELIISFEFPAVDGQTIEAITLQPQIQLWLTTQELIMLINIFIGQKKFLPLLERNRLNFGN